MENIEYANAYSEVLEILKNISKEDYEKVPSEKIDLFEKNDNKNYNFQYDTNLTLDEQNVSKRAKAIIAILFRDYWATPEQREKILAKQNYDRIQIEKNKQKQYNVDNIFKNKERKVETVENSVSMIEYKESIFSKIKKWFKQTFKKYWKIKLKMIKYKYYGNTIFITWKGEWHMTVVLICIFIALIILFGKLFIIGIRIIFPPKIDFYFFMAAILSISSLLGIISLMLMLIRLLKNLL